MCPAPKGNKFWEKRSKHGADKIFSDPDILWKECVSYFQWVEDNPLMEEKIFSFQGEIHYGSVTKMRAMTIGGLCIHLGIDPKTWYNYRSAEDLFPIITQVENIIREQKFTGAAADLLNANIIARDLGLADKKINEHSGLNGAPIKHADCTPEETYKQMLEDTGTE